MGSDLAMDRLSERLATRHAGGGARRSSATAVSRYMDFGRAAAHPGMTVETSTFPSLGAMASSEVHARCR